MEEEDAQEMIDEVDEDEEPVIQKKRFGNKKPEAQELVKEAVLDLDREIGRIRKEKASLNQEIKIIDQHIKNAEEVGKKVERLRYLRRVERLEAREKELTEKKRRLQQRDYTLDKRLNKVKSIKDKLSGV